MGVTRLKRTEILLSEREQELAVLALQRATVLDSLPANIAVLNGAGIITFVNRPWRQFGRDNGACDEGSACGDDYLGICDAATGEAAADAAEVAAAIRAIAAGRLDHFDSAYPCHAPATQRWFRCMIRPIVGGVVVMHLDITEKKLAELETIRAKSLIHQVGEQRNNLFANISHELRTPLNSIIGFSEMMINQPAGTQENYAEFAQNIHSSGSHLLQVVNDMLDLSRIENGEMCLEKEPVLLRKLIARLAAFYEEELTKKKINLTWDVAEDLVIVADEFRLRQLLSNFLSSAVKLTPTDGDINITSWRAANGDIHVAITDTGTGMAKEELDAALQPYGQLLNEISRHSGTGLGLPLAKQLIELHGGSLAVSGQGGGGTRIEVTLPGGAPGKDAEETVPAALIA